MFFIGLYRENVKKFFLSETTEPRALNLVCSINKWTSNKFVQIISLGQKWPCPGGKMIFIGLYWENVEIFLSETFSIT